MEANPQLLASDVFLQSHEMKSVKEGLSLTYFGVRMFSTPDPQIEQPTQTSTPNSHPTPPSTPDPQPTPTQTSTPEPQPSSVCTGNYLYSHPLIKFQCANAFDFKLKKLPSYMLDAVHSAHIWKCSSCWRIK